MSRLDSDTEAAVLAWWRSHRPLAWGESTHLREPTVNTCDHWEAKLARVAARLARRRKRAR